jgi:ubiquitin-like protein Pup
MAEQEHKRTNPARRGEESNGNDVTSAEADVEITDRIDDLLEEIDSVLEENAEEFVRNYVQKGGE